MTENIKVSSNIITPPPANNDLSNITSLNIQNTDNTKVGYIWIARGATSDVYAPNYGKWLVLRNDQISDSTAIKYEFNGATGVNFVGAIVSGGTRVAVYTSQVQSVSGILCVVLLRIE